MPFFSGISENLSRKRDRVFLNTLSSERMQLSYICLEPGESTSHSHLEEQCGYILRGELEIMIADDKRICRHRDAYSIPGNIPHGFKVLGDIPVEYIEVFSPPKMENL